jgi:hypothetical protein
MQFTSGIVRAILLVEEASISIRATHVAARSNLAKA